MKRAGFFFFLLAGLLAANLLRADETDAQVEARKVALDLAGAFSNDGFRLRDGHWAGDVKKGEPTLVAVNLYAGNQYWFSVGSAPEGKKFALHLFDENGQPVATGNFADEARSAIGFAPTMSGQYFVELAPGEGDSGGAYCLVYSYR